MASKKKLKRSASPLTSEEETARKKPTTIKPIDATADAVAAATTTVSSDASGKPMVTGEVADITKRQPHCSLGASCYYRWPKEKPQHYLDKYHPPPGPPPPKFDGETFFENVANTEQKYTWEQIHKVKLMKVLNETIGHTLIPDLQQIVVNLCEPEFTNTYLWVLKEIDECRPEDWTKSVKKKSVKSKKGRIESQPPPPYVSKIGGLPYLKSDETWPVCGGVFCGEKCLPFMFQLLLSDFPEQIGVAYQLPGIPLNNQLLQFFLCNVQNGGCGDSWEPYNTGSVVRIIDISDYNESTYQSSELKKTKDVDLLSEELIVGWSKHGDYPHVKDFERYGLKLPGRDDYLDFDQQVHRKYAVMTGEKLSGFPLFNLDSDIIQVHNTRTTGE